MIADPAEIKKEDLKNWKPVPLLGCDYKLMSSVFSGMFSLHQEKICFAVYFLWSRKGIFARVSIHIWGRFSQSLSSAQFSLSRSRHCIEKLKYNMLKINGSLGAPIKIQWR